MRSQKSAFFVTLVLAFLLWSNIGNASFITEYRLNVTNAAGAVLQDIFTPPASLTISGAFASATTSSLYAHGDNWYSDQYGMFLPGSALSELRIIPDSLTNFQISFDYEVDCNGAWANVSVTPSVTMWSVYSHGEGLKTGTYTGNFQVGSDDYFYLWVHAVPGQGEGLYSSAELTNLTITASQLPLPGTVLLMFTSFIGLIGIRRRYLK